MLIEQGKNKMKTIENYKNKNTKNIKTEELIDIIKNLEFYIKTSRYEELHISNLRDDLINTYAQRCRGINSEIIIDKYDIRLIAEITELVIAKQKKLTSEVA